MEFHRRAATVHRELKDQWQLAIALENILTAIDRSRSRDDVTPYRYEALSALSQLEDPRARAMRDRITAAGGGNG